MNRSGRRVLVLAALFALVPTVQARAQAPTGRITGVVRDAAGVALAGATVRVKHQATDATTKMEAIGILRVKMGDQARAAARPTIRDRPARRCIPNGLSGWQ